MASVRASLFRQVGRIEEAVDLWERARQANPDLILPRLELADHYVESGRLDEARVLVTEILHVTPEMTAEDAQWTAGRLMARSPENAAALAENLKKAGLP